MKNFIWFNLLCCHLVVAQSSLSSLLGSQVEKPKSSTYVMNNSKGQTAPVISQSSDAQNCLSKDEDHLSYKYLLALFRYKGDSISVVHDAYSGKLQLKAGPIISNCTSMINFELRSPVDAKGSYSVAARIKKPNKCVDNLCEYTVVEKVGDEVKEKIVKVEPTVKGFEECLKQTGVVTSEGIDQSKIVEKEFFRELSGAHVSASNVVFASQYPSFAGAVYQKESEGDNCVVYESISSEKLKLLSVKDAEQEKINAEALSACETNNYKTINEFLSRYNSFEPTMGKIRNELILKSMVKLAADVKSGKNPEELDFSVVDDFHKYIVDPMSIEAQRLYSELRSLPEGEAKKERQKELNNILAKIKELRKAPYLEKSSVETLLAKGLFDEARKVQHYHLTLEHHSNLGKKIDNVVVTPEVALSRIGADLDSFEVVIEDRRREYEVRTGQVTGKSAYYVSLAQKYRNQIPVRTKNFTEAVQQEYLKTLHPAQCGQQRYPCGYCYQYFRNTQQCINGKYDRQGNLIKPGVIQTTDSLKKLLVELNTKDTQIANELDKKAEQYAAWEEEGRRYVAAQSGEEAVVPEKNEDYIPEVTSTEAPVTGEDSSEVYQFQYNGQQQAGANFQQPQPNGFQPYMNQMSFQSSFQNPMMNNAPPMANWNQGQSFSSPYTFNYSGMNSGPMMNQNPWGSQPMMNNGVYNFYGNQGSFNNWGFNGGMGVGFNGFAGYNPNNYGFNQQYSGYGFQPTYYGPR